jgi:hypothetical protein
MATQVDQDGLAQGSTRLKAAVPTTSFSPSSISPLRMPGVGSGLQATGPEPLRREPNHAGPPCLVSFCYSARRRPIVRCLPTRQVTKGQGRYQRRCAEQQADTCRIIAWRLVIMIDRHHNSVSDVGRPAMSDMPVQPGLAAASKANSEPAIGPARHAHTQMRSHKNEMNNRPSQRVSDAHPAWPWLSVGVLRTNGPPYKTPGQAHSLAVPQAVPRAALRHSWARPHAQAEPRCISHWAMT